MEIISLKVVIVLEEGQLREAYFKINSGEERYHLLEMDHEMPCNIGIYEGICFLRWVWIWETMEEQDQVERAIDENEMSKLTQLVDAVNTFLHSSANISTMFDLTEWVNDLEWKIAKASTDTEETRRNFSVSLYPRKK